MATLPWMDFGEEGGEEQEKRPQLVGIARMAADGEHIREGHNIDHPDAIDSEPLQCAADAVFVDGESVSRMRVRVQVLLRALYARVHGAARSAGV